MLIPGFRAMKPAPKTGITRFGAGVHSFWKPEKNLPAGIVPSVIKSWKEAVVGGYFVNVSTACRIKFGPDRRVDLLSFIGVNKDKYPAITTPISGLFIYSANEGLRRDRG